MKIYDCTTFYSEHMMMDVRFNILDKHVEKFIVTESTFSHSGKKKPLNFDINNYPKFKDKIIYLVIDEEPKQILKKENTNYEKRLNSLKRIEQSYDYMDKAVKNVEENDLIILSDNDEIPNLDSSYFKKSKKDVIIFEQLFFYYKFNLYYDLMPWYGSKACKKKALKSFSWMRNLKTKKYPFWRLDTLFSKNKLMNLDIIKDGGWHFTNLKTPEELIEKFQNFGHHDEFEMSGITLEKLRDYMSKDIVFYDHLSDQKNWSKWNNNHKLKKIDDFMLPNFLRINKEKYKNWFK